MRIRKTDRFYFGMSMVYFFIGFAYLFTQNYMLGFIVSGLVGLLSLYLSHQYPKKFPELYTEKEDSKPSENPEDTASKSNEMQSMESIGTDFASFPQESHDPINDNKKQ